MLRLGKAGVWGVAVLLGAVLALAGQAAQAASIADQGWCVVKDGGTRLVALEASVTNDEASERSYQVKFTMESCEVTDLTKSTKPGAAAPAWSVVQTETTDPVSVPAGSSAVVTKRIPYEKMMAHGKAYRFQAELLAVPGGQTVGKTVIAARDEPFAGITGGVAGSGALASLGSGTAGLIPPRGGSRSAAAAKVQQSTRPMLDTIPIVQFPSGHGNMTGTHTAQRVGNQWVEHGTGVIHLSTSGGGVMDLNYVYDSTGASAAALTANAQASGTYMAPNGKGSLPVSVPAATASITFAGDRTQSGSVVTRTRATATGTFTATLGGQTFTGLLTIIKGTETLDLATGQGTHSFSVRFTSR